MIPAGPELDAQVQQIVWPTASPTFEAWSGRAQHIPEMVAWINRQGFTIELSQSRKAHWYAEAWRGLDSPGALGEGETIQHALADLVIAVSKARKAPQ